MIPIEGGDEVSKIDQQKAIDIFNRATSKKKNRKYRNCYRIKIAPFSYGFRRVLRQLQRKSKIKKINKYTRYNYKASR